MKNVVLLLLLSFSVSYGQVKKIEFDPNAKIDYSAIKVNVNTIKSPTKDLQLTYKSIGIKGIQIGHANGQGLPAYFSGQLPTNLASKGLQSAEYAKLYLQTIAPAMKIDAIHMKWELGQQQKDQLGMEHIRFAQSYKGVPIYGAEVICHGKEGMIDFVNGNYYAAFDLASVTPSIDQDQAMQACVSDRGQSIQYKHFMGPLADLMKETKQLVIYPHDGAFSLAYHISSYRNLAERWEYFIDAQTGAILNKFESLCKFHNHTSSSDICDTPVENGTSENELPPLDGKATANALDLFDVNRTINTYQVGTQFYMIDGSRDIFASQPSQLPDDPEGVIWTIDAFNTSPERNDFKYDNVKSGNNVWSNKTGVSAHYNGGKAFEYFQKTHARKSINGIGGNIVSLINVTDEDDKSMGNAFWNGAAMFYGNGDNAFKPLARGLDVAGHEMTHGVVQSTANLEYEGESGALNESFADVFGAMIDRDDWRVGEDVVLTSAFPSGALRSLEDPHNGQTTNNFNKGWQPRTFNERYTGNEDNGGVHLNSGIPNWAFFKFATAVGKDKAEKVYYRALSNYLTKSSKFVDCRVAVVKATTDLYGATEIAAARKAFDEVGILGDSGGSYENNANDNPGADFVLVTDVSNNGLYILDAAGANLGKISNSGVLSKPSVSDDGANIVFIGKDKKMHYIAIDWSANPVTPEEDIIEENPIWRNVIISKDGNRIGALTDEEKPEIIVFDVSTSQGSSNTFDLYNPTFSTGQETGDVNYADAMEFDLSGEYIMYDAENEINSVSSGSINYWDISFIKVWNNTSNSFSLGKVEKLYASLPEGVSVGNPTFSKNSPFIIAFDYIKEDNTVDIVGANIERSEANVIFKNGELLGYPNYSSDDKKLSFDAEDNGGNEVVGVTNLKPSKIEPTGNAAVFVSDRRWAVWFSNGKRALSSIGEPHPQIGAISVLQNPTSDNINAVAQLTQDFTGQVLLTDLMGKTIYTTDVQWKVGEQSITIPVQQLPAGLYNLSLVGNGGVSSVQVAKM